MRLHMTNSLEGPTSNAQHSRLCTIVRAALLCGQVEIKGLQHNREAEMQQGPFLDIPQGLYMGVTGRPHLSPPADDRLLVR